MTATDSDVRIYRMFRSNSLSKASLFLVVVLCFVTISAQDTLAQSAYVQPNSTKATETVRHWQLKTNQEPKKALNFFNLAVAHHKKKSFKKALRLYAQVIRMKSKLTPVCYYYIAKILFEQERFEKANRALDKIDIEAASPELRRRIVNLTENLIEDDEEPEKEQSNESEEQRFFAFWNLVAGSNDNPAFESSLDGTDLQYGASLFLSYQLFATTNFESKGQYSFSAISYRDTASSNTTYHDASLPLAYYLNDLRIRLTPHYIADTYGGISFSNTISAEIELTLKLGRSYLGVSQQYLDTRVTDSDNSYLDGYAGKSTLFFSYQWPSADIKTNIFYSDYRYADTSDVTSTYFAPALDLNYTYYTGAWDFSAYGLFEKRTYTADSTGVVRKDDRSQYSLTSGYTFKRWLRVYFNASYNGNSSNDSDNDYKQFVFLVGASGGI